MRNGVNPWIFSSLRIMLGEPILIMWALLFDRHIPNAIPPKRAWPLVILQVFSFRFAAFTVALFVQSIVGGTIPVLTFSLSLSLTTVTTYAFLTPFSPILTTMLAVCMRLEKGSLLKYAGPSCASTSPPHSLQLSGRFFRVVSPLSFACL